MPKVSIIIPVYNAYNFFNICLDSMINQTYRNIEIIIIDDKSNDDTVSLIKTYITMHKQIKLIELDHNQGVSHARNVGKKMATGEYLIFIDSDDFIDLDAVEKMVNVALQYDADIVELKKLFWYRENNNTFALRFSKKREKIILGTIFLNNKVVFGSSFVTGKLYHQRLIEKVFFDETIKCYEDGLFSQEIKAKIKVYLFLNNVFYHYIQRKDSLVNTINIDHLDYLKVIKRINQIYIDNDYYHLPIKNNVDNFIVDSIILVVAFRIVRIKMNNEQKIKVIKDFLNYLKTSFKNIPKFKKIIINLLSNKLFLLLYIPISNKINALNIGLQISKVFYRYQIKNKATINQATVACEIINMK